MNIQKQLARRSKRVFKLAEGVTAQESFQFHKKRMFVGRKKISCEEALDRLGSGEEVYLDRNVLIERTKERTESYASQRAGIEFSEVRIKDRQALEQRIDELVSSPFPLGLYNLDSKSYLPQDAIDRAARIDTDNSGDFSRYERHHNTHEWELHRLVGKRRPEFSKQSSLLPKTEGKMSLLENMRNLQSVEFLNGEFSQAKLLADGAAFLEQNNLHTDPEMAFALLVDEVAHQERQGVEEAQSRLRDETSRVELFGNYIPETANSALAYHALASTFEASEGGIFSPAAPLVSEVQEKLNDLRSRAKSTPARLGQIADIDNTLREADTDETITNFFHRVKHSSKHGEALGSLSQILSEEFGPPDSGKSEAVERIPGSTAQPERFPLIRQVKASDEDDLPIGYLSKDEVIERISSLQVEALESANMNEAYNLEASKNILRQLGASHNGQIYSELSKRYKSLSRKGSIEDDPKESEFSNDFARSQAKGLRHAYNAARVASHLPKEYQKRTLSLADVSKRMERRIKSEPNDLVLRENIGRTKLLMARVDGEGDVNGLITQAYDENSKLSLRALADTLEL